MLVKNGNIVGSGVNTFRNDPAFVIAQSTEYSVHAEKVALRRAGDKARGAVIYVARVNSQGEPRLSRPCNHCYPDLVEAGIKVIIST